MRNKTRAALLSIALLIASVSVFQHAFAATWAGTWESSKGHWSGTIEHKFDDSGSRAWTDAEKKVIREAVQEWNDLLKGTGVSLEEGTPADLNLNWNNSMAGTTAGEMTGGDGNGAPTGVKFNPKSTAGLYVDPNPAGNTPIPDRKWDLVSVAKHELGHALGLKHAFGTASIMDTWGPGQRQRPTDADAAILHRLYPLTTLFVGQIRADFRQSEFATHYTVTAQSLSGTPTISWRLRPPANDRDCNHFSGSGNEAVWHHGDQDSCDHAKETQLGHTGTVSVEVTDTRWICQAEYYGTMSGTGPSPFCTQK